MEDVNGADLPNSNLKLYEDNVDGRDIFFSPHREQITAVCGIPMFRIRYVSRCC
jgi:hypothetical protein